MRDVLATGRKLLTWGYKGEVKCVFCRYGIEDGSFFFFVGSVVEFGSMLWAFVMS